MYVNNTYIHINIPLKTKGIYICIYKHIYTYILHLGQNVYSYIRMCVYM